MKAVIVDDERIAGQELRRLLSAHPEVQIAGEAGNGEEAISLGRETATGCAVSRSSRRFSPDHKSIEVSVRPRRGAEFHFNIRGMHITTCMAAL